MEKLQLINTIFTGLSTLIAIIALFISWKNKAEIRIIEKKISYSKSSSTSSSVSVS